MAMTVPVWRPTQRPTRWPADARGQATAKMLESRNAQPGAEVMSRRNRTIIVAIPVVVIVLLAAAFALRNHLVKAAIERGGSYALGVETRLDSAKLDFGGGRFSLRGFRVANPEGFAEPWFLEMDRGAVSIEKGSLLGDQVEIPSLRLQGIRLFMDKREGKANYETIVESLQRFETDGGGGKAPREEESADAEGGKLLIREIAIHDIQVSAELLPLGGELTRSEFTIDEIVLKNVGGGSEEGLSVADVTAIVMKAVLSSALSVGGKVLPDEIESGLGMALGGVADLSGLGIDVVAFTAEGAIDVVGSAAKGVVGAGKGIGGKIKDLGRGLFGGGEDKEGRSENENEAVPPAGDS
jgi:hypothetical protein